MNNLNRKNFIFLSTRCSLLWAEGFSCGLDVLFVGLEKLIAIFEQMFGHQNPGSGLVAHRDLYLDSLEMLDLDLQLCLKGWPY